MHTATISETAHFNVTARRHAAGLECFARPAESQAAAVKRFMSAAKRARTVSDRRRFPVFKPGMSTADYVAMFEAQSPSQSGLQCRGFWAPLNSEPATLYAGGALDFAPELADIIEAEPVAAEPVAELREPVAVAVAVAAVAEPEAAPVADAPQLAEPEPVDMAESALSRGDFAEFLRLKREETARQVAAVGDLSGGGILADDTGRRFVFVLPDVSGGGRWRMSRFDADGFSGHEVHPDMAAAVLDAVGQGFRTRDDGALDRVQLLPSFHRGNHYADLIQQHNRGLLPFADIGPALAAYDAAEAAAAVPAAAPDPVEVAPVPAAPSTGAGPLAEAAAVLARISSTWAPDNRRAAAIAAGLAGDPAAGPVLAAALTRAVCNGGVLERAEAARALVLLELEAVAPGAAAARRRAAVAPPAEVRPDPVPVLAPVSGPPAAAPDPAGGMQPGDVVAVTSGPLRGTVRGLIGPAADGAPGFVVTDTMRGPLIVPGVEFVRRPVLAEPGPAALAPVAAADPPAVARPARRQSWARGGPLHWHRRAAACAPLAWRPRPGGADGPPVAGGRAGAGAARRGPGRAPHRPRAGLVLWRDFWGPAQCWPGAGARTAWPNQLGPGHAAPIDPARGGPAAGAGPGSGGGPPVPARRSLPVAGFLTPARAGPSALPWLSTIYGQQHEARAVHGRRGTR